MSRRTKIIIAALVILALLIAALLLLLSRQPAQEVKISTPTEGGNSGVGLINGMIAINTSVNVSTEPVKPAAPAPKADPGTGPRQLAKSFTERYGSFSNQADYENIIDLYAFMSSAMRARSEAYVASESLKPPAQTYFGMTTRSINVELVALDESGGKATATVKTQRQEFTSATGKPDVYYQDASVELVKEEGVWKVDSLTWQPK